MAAKKKAASGETAEPITLRWDLHELPSSQHRAGLVGLKLMVDWLRRRPDAKGVCEITECTASTLALRVDADGMQALFDETYAATTEEVLSKTPYKGKEPKRTQEVTVEKKDKRGATQSKSETRYVYDIVVPGGAWLSEVEPSHEEHRTGWVKLWRDFIWSILRGVPATRTPFEERAAGEVSKDGMETFALLARGAEDAIELPSTYSLGAQAESADAVPVRDRARYRLLLHFWPYVARIYVPTVVDDEGKREHSGFAVAIPDVCDVSEMAPAWREVLQGRSSKLLGYRPEGALIDLPAEAALDTFAAITSRVQTAEGRAATTDLLLAVDVVHCEKEGNNVRVRGLSRVAPRARMVDEYQHVRRAYWSQVFRQQRVRNVLAERPWWDGFDRVLALRPASRTIGDDYFRRDSREAFENVEVQMSEQHERTIEGLVYRAIGTYLSGRLKSKYGLDWSGSKGDEVKKGEYGEKREKLAKDAFLAVRARTGADFVAYFTGTLCSVVQHLDEEAYALLAKELLTSPERVRTLTLLALSARG